MVIDVDVKPKRGRSRKPYGKSAPTSRAKESSIEDYLRDRVQRAGGYCIKLPAELYVGIPDRLVILPNYVIFVELKRPEGGRVAKTQSWWRDTLRNMGHYAEVLRSKEEIDQLLRDFT